MVIYLYSNLRKNKRDIIITVEVALIPTKQLPPQAHNDPYRSGMFPCVRVVLKKEKEKVELRHVFYIYNYQKVQA